MQVQRTKRIFLYHHPILDINTAPHSTPVAARHAQLTITCALPIFCSRNNMIESPFSVFICTFKAGMTKINSAMNGMRNIAPPKMLFAVLE